MNTVLIVAGVYLAGWIVTFRLDAWYAIARQNERRDDAIRQATRTATVWPLAGLALVAICIHGLLVAGLPKSQADRDAEIAELEREALGDVMADRMATALREGRRAENRPDKPLVCVNCGVPLVPAKAGFVHVPEGWYTPCDDAVPTWRTGRATADNSDREARRIQRQRALLRKHHVRKGHPIPFAACPECWPMLP